MDLPDDRLSRPDSTRIAATRARVERLAWLLEGCIGIPGTRFKIGIEPIIGLIPGVGDLVGLVMGGAIIYESLRIGAPRHLIFRMLGNAGLDALVGAVPLAGDLFDFAFKSNRRNARLLSTHLDRLQRVEQAPGPQRRGLGLLVLLVFLALAAGVVWGLSRILQAAGLL